MTPGPIGSRASVYVHLIVSVRRDSREQVDRDVCARLVGDQFAQSRAPDLVRQDDVAGAPDFGDARTENEVAREFFRRSPKASPMPDEVVWMEVRTLDADERGFNCEVVREVPSDAFGVVPDAVRC